MAYIDLNSKLVTPDQLAEWAVDDTDLLQEILEGIAPQTQKSSRRENCSKAVLILAETWPEVLIPHWDYFIGLLKSTNGSSKYVAVYAIASLCKIDKNGQFAHSFSDYFAALDDESVMVASHAALNSVKIAQALPALQPQIINQLLSIDQTHHNSGHLALIKAYILESLDLLYESADNQAEILEFVKKQLQSESPKTIKLSKAFIQKRSS